VTLHTQQFTSTLNCCSKRFVMVFRELLHINYNAFRLGVTVGGKRCRSYCVGDSKSLSGRCDIPPSRSFPRMNFF
jgi:hypothetical protein